VDVILIVPYLLLALIVLDIDHYTVEANDDRASPLCITICYGEELALTNRLSTTNVYKDA
jgi:hypothetical protein